MRKRRPPLLTASTDQLYRELAELEKKYPQFAREDSPTRRVGGQPLKQFAQVHASRADA